MGISEFHRRVVISVVLIFGGFLFGLLSARQLGNRRSLLWIGISVVSNLSMATGLGLICCWA